MTFERWENGVTEIDEEHLNQLIDAWDNIFGVLGPNPTRLVKLPAPVVNGTYGGLVPGWIWLDESLANGGALTYKDSAGVDVRLSPRIKVEYGNPMPAPQIINSLTFSPVSGLSASFTPSASSQSIKIRFGVANSGAQHGVVVSAAGSIVLGVVRVTVTKNGVDWASLADHLVGGGAGGGTSFSAEYPASCFAWDYVHNVPFTGTDIWGARAEAMLLFAVTGMQIAFSTDIMIILEEVPTQ